MLTRTSKGKSNNSNNNNSVRVGMDSITDSASPKTRFADNNDDDEEEDEELIALADLASARTGIPASQEKVKIRRVSISSDAVTDDEHHQRQKGKPRPASPPPENHHVHFKKIADPDHDRHHKPPLSPPPEPHVKFVSVSIASIEEDAINRTTTRCNSVEMLQDEEEEEELEQLQRRNSTPRRPSPPPELPHVHFKKIADAEHERHHKPPSSPPPPEELRVSFNEKDHGIHEAGEEMDDDTKQQQQQEDCRTTTDKEALEAEHKEFEEHRKRHYQNEIDAVRKFRQEHPEGVVGEE